MAWSDEPTEAQLNAIFMLIRWSVPTYMAKNAIEWLSQHATRREVSYEIKRIRSLYLKHSLDRSNCFSDKIWDGFDYEEANEIART